MENVLCLRKSALTPLLLAPLRHFLSGFCCRFAQNLSDTLEMSIKHNCEMIEFPLSDDARQKKHVFSSNSKRHSGGCSKFCHFFFPAAAAALAVIKLSLFLPSFLFSIRSLCLRAFHYFGVFAAASGSPSFLLGGFDIPFSSSCLCSTQFVYVHASVPLVFPNMSTG